MQRNLLYSGAARSIGSVPSSEVEGKTTLDRKEIPRYLVTIGCPELFETLTLLTLREDNVRTAVDEAAKNGWFGKYFGMAVSGNAAMEYAAVTSSEFLRRGRTVAWRSAEGIFEVAPRRVIRDEEDELVNTEFFTLTTVYELLVIHGIQPFGHTEYEERTFFKVLNERATRLMPTVIVVAPSTATAEPAHSPVAMYLINNYLAVTL
jgi:hypothetical protein